MTGAAIGQNGRMDDLEELGRHVGPRGEVVLRRRTTSVGDPVEELIVNGAFAMDSAETETERRLGALARQGRGGRILVGGLGLGYTAAEILTGPSTSSGSGPTSSGSGPTGSGDVERVDVVEIEEVLIDWAYAGLTPTLAAVAGDPLVRLHAGDIRQVLTSAQPPSGPWDAIVLDVDNGPEFLIHAGNDALYAESTLRAAYGQLAPGGSMAIWCEGVTPDLLATLDRIGPDPREHRYPVRRGERRFTYAIYELIRPVTEPH